MRICIVGDTGSGTTEQYLVAKHIQKYNNTNKLDAVILLGDNIYEEGVNSTDDPQFQDKFELPYQSINLPFYLLLGNHDYANLSGTHAYNNHAIHQVNYHKLSDKWNMPRRYYSVQIGNNEFFMLDTNLDNMTHSEISQQVKFMKKKINKSKKTNKFLCGHHTWRSTGGHGNADRQFEKFMRDIVVGTNIKGYFCGHDHCKNYIAIPFPQKRKTIRKTKRKTKRKSKLFHIFVVGTGGKSMDESHLAAEQIRKPDKLIYHDANLGFIILDSQGNKTSIKMYSTYSSKKKL